MHWSCHRNAEFLLTTEPYSIMFSSRFSSVAVRWFFTRWLNGFHRSQRRKLLELQCIFFLHLPCLFSIAVKNHWEVKIDNTVVIKGLVHDHSGGERKTPLGLDLALKSEMLSEWMYPTAAQKAIKHRLKMCLKPVCSLKQPRYNIWACCCKRIRCNAQ